MRLKSGGGHRHTDAHRTCAGQQEGGHLREPQLIDQYRAERGPDG